MPQGAPTSPTLSNLVCRGLDARLGGLANRNGAVYTRYADDLTFSFTTPGTDLGRFRWWVDQICQQEGFLVRQSKFRVIRAAQRQVRLRMAQARMRQESGTPPRRRFVPPTCNSRSSPTRIRT